MKLKLANMNRSATAVLILLVASIWVVKVSAQPDPNFYIFLAFGQSNMEGYPGQQEHQDSINLPVRFQTLPALDWPDGSRKQGVWTAALPPLCRNTTGLCPCDYFGRTLADSLPSNIKIGIINVAVAGCAIEMFDEAKYQAYVATQASWMQADAALYGGDPYARLVAMGKAAQQVGVIKGILMHQGESGSSTGNWTGEVKTVYNNLIKDLSLDSNTTPLLAGGLTNDNSNSSLPWTLVKPTRIFKNAYVVSSQGDSANSTGIHFSASGYRGLGKSYADTMLILFKKLGTGPTGVIDKKVAFDYSIRNFVESSTGDASISFEIPQRAFVTLNAYSLGGQEIAQLARGEFSAGGHSVLFSRMEMPTGAIILRMNSGSNSAARMILTTAP